VDFFIGKIHNEQRRSGYIYWENAVFPGIHLEVPPSREAAFAAFKKNPEKLSFQLSAFSRQLDICPSSG
jgi:hypothetical protein